MKIQKNILLKNHTTFKIGGPAKYFVAAKSEKDIITAVKWAKENRLPFFILGGGSNLLVADDGFNGLVIKIKNYKLKIKNSKVIADAGVSLAQLVAATASAGLSGMEWASGIPGATLGGAIRGNAGAFETEMKNLVQKVKVLDVGDQKIKIFDNKNCQFGYRSSIFSIQGGSPPKADAPLEYTSGGKKNTALVILSAELELKKSDKEKVKEKTKEILGYRTGRHPKFPSAGSIFKNLENMRARDLIEKAGLKGKTIGGAQISEQHANFIVNIGAAKARDVLDLIDLAKKEVKKKFNVQLEEEIYFLK